MKNVQFADFLVLAGLLALVFLVIPVGTAEAGCGGYYGGASYGTSYHAPAYFHNAYNYTYPTYYQSYRPLYISTPHCGGIYW